jgi:hypothetical protein
MPGSAIEGCEEATAPPYKGGGHQKAQPYVLPMPKSEEQKFKTNRKSSFVASFYTVQRRVIYLPRNSHEM